MVIMSSPSVKPLHTKPLYTWMYDALYSSVQGKGEGRGSGRGTGKGRAVTFNDLTLIHFYIY